MRTFVALNLSPERRAELHVAVEPLRIALGRAVSWTGEHALHLTLRFLGEQPPELADRLCERLAGPLAGLPPVDLDLGGVGAFPSLARPRVLWMGVAANPDLSRLYQEVDSAVAALGVPREERAFHPHVTIGRVRERVRVDTGALAGATDEVRYHAREPVAAVDVMESVLGPGGARYRVLCAVPPGGEDEEA